jgi:hypothetical protein
MLQCAAGRGAVVLIGGVLGVGSQGGQYAAAGDG